MPPLYLLMDLYAFWLLIALHQLAITYQPLWLNDGA